MPARKNIPIGIAIVCCSVLVSAQAGAQWWSSTPRDYEDCAAAAQKGPPDTKANALSDCEAKFAGRRKPGGGYTYYDFMQNRHFDIAGPNPTAAEQKYIDEQYTAYLNDRRRRMIATAFLQKQQAEQARTSSGGAASRDVLALSGDTFLSGDAAARSLRPMPKAAPPHIAVLPRPRPKAASRCKSDELFSQCRWSRISSGVRDLKKALFGSFARRDVRS